MGAWSNFKKRLNALNQRLRTKPQSKEQISRTKFQESKLKTASEIY